MLQTQWLANQEWPLRTGKLISKFCILKAPVKRWDGSTWCREERHMFLFFCMMHECWELWVTQDTWSLFCHLIFPSFFPHQNHQGTPLAILSFQNISVTAADWSQSPKWDHRCVQLCVAAAAGLRERWCRFQPTQTLSSSPRWYPWASGAKREGSDL